MSSEAEPIFLRDLIEVNPKVKMQKGQNYPFVDMASVKEWQRDVSVEDAELREFKGSGSKFEAGDILLARITPCFENGKTALAPARHGPGHGSTEFIVIRPKNPKDHAFVYGLLRSPEFRSHAIGQMVGTSGRQRIPNEAVLSFPLELPADSYRHKAAHLLGSIEDTCSTLRHQNTALEAIAQRLFRSWFVNFDPVHAKAAGKEPEAMSAELAALFPSEFEDSELGPIPKGWCAGSLHDVSLLNPEAWASRNHPAEVFYIDLSGVKKNVFSEVTRYTFDEAPSRARRVLRKGDSLYGTVRPGNLSYGYIGANLEGLTGSTGFAVLRPKAAVNAEFVYCAMTLKENIERLVLLAEGAAYPAVRPEIVQAQKVALPGNSLMTAFHDATRHLFEQHAVNQALIVRLGEFRDHLLPRLISGKLSLEDAERAVEEAVAA